MSFRDKLNAVLNGNKREIRSDYSRSKPIYCLENGEVFDNIIEAEIKYGTDINYSLYGNDKDVEYHFKHVEYTSFDKCEFITGKPLVFKEKVIKPSKHKKVKCIETNEVLTYEDAVKKYGSGIKRVCDGVRKTMNKLHFEWVD